jgi:hypothetical protein
MIEIYQDGKLKMTIEEIGSPTDIVVIPKNISCSMTSQGFTKVFFSCLSGRSHTEAYDKAEEIHTQYFQQRKYSSYESFRVSCARAFKGR